MFSPKIEMSMLAIIQEFMQNNDEEWMYWWCVVVYVRWELVSMNLQVKLVTLNGHWMRKKVC